MNDFNIKDVSYWIKYYRIKANISQQDMSEKLGISLVSYKKYEKNIKNMNISRLKSIAYALDISIDKFLVAYDKSVKDLQKRVLTDSQKRRLFTKRKNLKIHYISDNNKGT